MALKVNVTNVQASDTGSKDPLKNRLGWAGSHQSRGIVLKGIDRWTPCISFPRLTQWGGVGLTLQANPHTLGWAGGGRMEGDFPDVLCR